MRYFWMTYLSMSLRQDIVRSPMDWKDEDNLIHLSVAEWKG
jgi:hypothetical protein